MKNVLFLTNGVHIRTNGRTIASYGYCREFAKYTSLKAFSTIPYNADAAKAAADVDEGLDLEFVKEDKRTIWNTLTRLEDFRTFKKIGIIEISKPNTYKAAEQYIRSNPVDIVIIDHLALARFFFYLKKRFPNLTYVYNSHNAEAINYYQQLTGKEFKIENCGHLDFDNAQQKKKYDYISNIENRLLQETDYTIAISKGDAELLSTQYGITREKILITRPLTRFARVKEWKDVQKFSHKLLIVGSMGWYPNVRGIIWFIENVFDMLIKQDPRYKLYVVGRGPTRDLVEICKKYPNNIVLTGEVPSTDPYFKECDISIVPVFEGTGIKIKVIESLSRGIPTICAAYAAKDYDVDGEMIVAETAQDYLDGIHAIEQSVQMRETLYDKMLAFCSTYYELTDDLKKLFDYEK